MPPLFDLPQRVVSFHAQTPVEATIDALLRMHADRQHWRRPITLYLGMSTNFHQPPRALETLALCGVLAALRSPIHTFSGGLLTGCELLALAAGTPGHRYLLPHSLIYVGGPAMEGLPNHMPGLNPSHTSLRTQAQDLIRGEVNALTERLGLSPEIWAEPKIYTAAQAIQARLADAIVPLRPPIISQHERTKL